jgi:hypothetical protein
MGVAPPMGARRKAVAMSPDKSVANDFPSAQGLPAEGRLAASRAQLESLLLPYPEQFPRSRTMRFLIRGGGKALASGAVAGLMAVRPGLAANLLRISPIARVLRRLL